MSIPTFRTWVKINGFYPVDGMAEAHRSKDRLVLHIGRVVGHRGDVVPEHSVSIEMWPVLPAFLDTSRTSEFRGLAESEDTRCTARLSRGGHTIARCQLEDGHDGDHIEAGCGEHWDNWPPLASIRWPAGTDAFVAYDPEAIGAWKWEEDEAPPDLSIPFTGHLGSGVRRLNGRRCQKRRVILEVPLPPLEQFLSRRRDVDPLTLFLTWVGRQIGGVPAGRLLDSARVFLCRADLDRLLEIEAFWAERLTGEASAAWSEVLNLSPVSFQSRRGSDPGWTRTGRAYIAEGIYREERPLN